MGIDGANRKLIKEIQCKSILVVETETEHTTEKQNYNDHVVRHLISQSSLSRFKDHVIKEVVRESKLNPIEKRQIEKGYPRDSLNDTKTTYSLYTTLIPKVPFL